MMARSLFCYRFEPGGVALKNKGMQWWRVALGVSGLVIALAVSGCGEPEPADTADEPVVTERSALEGQWQLASLQQGDIAFDDIEGSYWILFNSIGIVEGYADCKGFLGRYTTDSARQLKLSPLQHAFIACPFPTLADVYLGVIQSTRRYERQGDRLIIHSTLGSQAVFILHKP